MEELGIGRPSTYASIMQTIQDRGYVWKKGNALVPSWVAFAVVNLLEQHFARLVDYDFTASMEEDLDAIAGGGMQSVDWLTRFYFGSENGEEGGIARAGGLKRMVASGSATSTPAASTRSRSTTASSSGSAGTGPTWSAARATRASVPEDLPRTS